MIEERVPRNAAPALAHLVVTSFPVGSDEPDGE
jgi:hypothetical protein